MKARHKRLALILFGIAILSAGVWMVLRAFNENMNLFVTPSEVAAGKAPAGRNFRLGGMVQAGSLQRQADGVTVSFVITDMAQKVPVSYKGILPDLFKEGKGVIAQGKMDGAGRFLAQEVLAKHDENYMPPEAAYAMKKAQQDKMRDAENNAPVTGPKDGK
ncbi:MAG: cytochrome c maturation protein CcmE [Pseudomonadota bacterium]|jgi:cytochrome c-type biogenesis protein CcmE